MCGSHFLNCCPGDYGDGDLQRALQNAAASGCSPAMVTFGHMHQALYGSRGTRLRNMAHVDAATGNPPPPCPSPQSTTHLTPSCWTVKLSTLFASQSARVIALIAINVSCDGKGGPHPPNQYHQFGRGVWGNCNNSGIRWKVHCPLFMNIVLDCNPTSFGAEVAYLNAAVVPRRN